MIALLQHWFLILWLMVLWILDLITDPVVIIKEIAL